MTQIAVIYHSAHGHTAHIARMIIEGIGQVPGIEAQLLEAGVRILRYRVAMVHAKTATVDGTWTTVGTANIDRLSLSGNYEINVEAIDRGLAEVMEEIFAVDESNCLELTIGEWEARDLHRKFTEFVLAPLRPLL